MNSNAYIQENEELKIVKFPIFDKYRDEIIAAFSTRCGGVSKDIYESMNLAFGRGDTDENVLENYKIITEYLGINYRDIVMSSQYHHNNIRVIKEEDKGKGIIKDRNYKDIDGLITAIPQIPLVTFHADCSSIYFYDPIKKVIGLAHAGWKGTTMEIAGNMVEIMVKEFGTNAIDLIIAIGPSICNKCYEIDEDVREKFENMSIDSSQYISYDSEKNKYYPDINNINKAILISKGVKEENIGLSNICTMENKELFFSHRGHKGKRGTQAAIVQLK
ncbi:MAG: peptidoglycan editing factor PgeF [Senegalia sp. (in: firmicutes)]|uniref:peptidoglycan editing factor PgeF n=1 Tax=Senegalia sp. (in: firmicutes) TaxID=1924098 RepID=UPI003F973EF6